MNKENGESENYVLDSTAFLALFEDEPGAETVQKLLERAKKGEIVIFTSFVSFTEVFYITLREKKEEEAKKRIKLMNVLAMMRVESSQELGLIAGRLKSKYLVYHFSFSGAASLFFLLVFLSALSDLRGE